ncbi:class I mannose-6-phosphate isomerase [Sphingobium sp.]|uniref:class I mannose-6-phosphate isomerase n=1 Tax=Sphingobium sp. TaxID=1912891 RepID=UPI002BEA4139|nr:class I mannose-6-phosphate isomerase [Sphingobium sp.]HUD92121.1 class I mannose-6-phosphate isomerase [Sphingobium sp.]
MTCYRLTPHIVEKPWGRDDIPANYGATHGQRIGEVWFTGPESLAQPLLVKYLFTSARLSIQVHPDDDQAQARGLAGGKSECWYVLDTQGDARLGIGLRRPIDTDRLRAAVIDGSIEELMDWKPVRSGSFYYIPAGTIHAIGGGLTLVEVQQNNDVTYRLYDYGRPRELHLDDGLAVSRPEPYALPQQRVSSEASALLVDEQRAPFSLENLVSPAGETLRLGDGLCWFVPLLGRGLIDGQPWQAGECWLIDSGADLSVEQALHALLARPAPLDRRPQVG